LTDHTELWTRLQSEMELEISDFVELASDWFWVMDSDLRYIYFSPRVEAVTGDTPEWHYGKTRQDIGITIEDESDDLVQRRAFRDVLISRTNKSGRHIWIKASGKPIYGRDGEFKGFIGTGTDVSAEIEARQSVEERNRLFIDAMENMGEGFALFDASEALVFCNTAFKKMNPELAGDLEIGMTFSDMVKSNLREGRIIEAIGREEEFLAKRLEEFRNPTNELIESHRRDGRILLLRTVRLEEGSTFLINTDQTDLRRREADLVVAKEEAEKANRAKSAFLASMSHELRTPLNAILGFAEAMSSGSLKLDRAPEFAADIHRSGTHLLSLIDDLLDLTAIENQRVELDMVAQHPRDVIARALSTMAPIAREAAVRLRGKASKSLPDVVLDQRSIDQCLLNLVSNAIKFSEHGSVVVVSANLLENQWAEFLVSDDGAGMNEDQILQIGTPYTRPAAQEGKQGAGLGLTITRGLAELMGGTLMIESAPGAGTKAMLRFPLTRLTDTK